MKIRKVIFLLLLPLFAEFIIACCNCNLETTYYNYSNCNVNISELDNSGANAIVTNAATIPEKAFGIRVSIDRVENSCFLKTNSFISNSAFATSCDCPPEYEYRAKEKVVSIEIISVNNFDGSHNAGSDIAEYFRIYNNYEFFETDLYLESINSGIKESGIIPYEFDMFLMKTPVSGTNHQFIVNIELSDGRVLSDQTRLIELK